MVRVCAQPFVTSTSAQLTVGTLQLSVAPTAGLQPGTLVGLQPRFVLAGQLVNTGGVVSTTVMIWSHVAELLQASVAFHVRVIVALVGQLPPGVGTSLKVMTMLVPQRSVAVATPVKLGVV